MASIKLRDAINKTARISYTCKPELNARTCDACERAFAMPAPTGHTYGHLGGIFDRCAEDADGRGLGNMFSADVCSFACAQALYDGGWKTMDAYAPYVKAGASLERVSLTIGELLTESDLIAEWEERGELGPPTDNRLFIGGSFR